MTNISYYHYGGTPAINFWDNTVSSFSNIKSSFKTAWCWAMVKATGGNYETHVYAQLQIADYTSYELCSTSVTPQETYSDSGSRTVTLADCTKLRIYLAAWGNMRGAHAQCWGAVQIRFDK